MIRIQKAEERGSTRTGWLDSRHSFSFGGWHDGTYVHFGPLRVVNDDFVRAGAGFPTHPHRDMEIITYVIEGALEHRDSSGGSGVIRAGEVQRMRAGRGITHSEYNHSQDQDLHFLQIWIIPSQLGLDPGYAQLEFTTEQRRNVLLPVAIPEGSAIYGPAGTLGIAQDTVMSISRLERGHTVELHLGAGRGGYVFVIDGSVDAGGFAMDAGDSLQAEAESLVAVTAREDSELLVFDLPLHDWDAD